MGILDDCIIRKQGFFKFKESLVSTKTGMVILVVGFLIFGSIWKCFVGLDLVALNLRVRLVLS